MNTAPSRAAWPACLAIVAASLAVTSRAELIHRYSFNESGGTTVEDSVGTADGTIKGNGSYFDGAGRLFLLGGTGSAAAPEAISGYVDLPNGIISPLDRLTVETWVMWDGSIGAWQRIFDFGTSAGGEDVVNGNGNYLFLSPAGNANLRFAVRDPVTGTEPTQLTAAAPLPLAETVCVTVTYDPPANTARLYTNGVLLVSGPAPVQLEDIVDVNNWLGRSQWDDGMFMGNYDEFRIYDTALNPVEVAASYVAGVAQPSTDPARLGAVQTVTLTVPKTLLTEGDTMTATGAADFANMAGVSLSGVAGVTLVSDNNSVLTVDAAGLVTAVTPGTAKLTLTYSGRTDEETINVNARQTGIAVAGSLVVDLRAADASNDPLSWPNRANPGTEDDFYAVGGPAYVANVEGTGVAGVQLGATTPLADCYTGPLTTAELHGGSDRSIEVWVYNPALADEETLVAWGQRGGPAGSNMSFNYGANATYGAVGHWDSPDMGWSGSPAAAQWHYLVYTYDGVSTARVYADGVLKTTRVVTGGLNTHPDLPIRIGAQSNTSGSDADFGQALSAYIAMVRVHTGELSASDVSNNYLYGPTLTPPGELQTVAIEPGRTTLHGARDYDQARVVADFATLKNVNVTGFSALESSDPTVLTVTAAGEYTAVKVGAATIQGAYQGRPVSQAITVVEPPLGLRHRYSFNEAPGTTTVEDLEGNADGEVKGIGADFDGAGRLVLPGGGGSAADPVSGYVDLPNGIISPLVNVSFEAWVTWDGPTTSQWQRIFDLGTSAGGEDVVNGNGAYFFLSPAGPANLRFAVRDPRTGGEPTQLTASAPLTPGEEVYVAAIYDYTSNQARLYRDAVEVASGPANVPTKLINDVNNWLGRSQWDDAMFAGSYNEFRIWEGALSAAQVTANFATGPNSLPAGGAEIQGISRNAQGQAVITYSGVLQGADVVTGPYADVAGATSPYAVTPSGAQRYFRSRGQ